MAGGVGPSATPAGLIFFRGHISLLSDLFPLYGLQFAISEEIPGKPNRIVSVLDKRAAIPRERTEDECLQLPRLNFLFGC